MRLRTSLSGIGALLLLVLSISPAAAAHRVPAYAHIDNVRLNDAGRMVVRATFWCDEAFGLGLPDGPGAWINVDEYTPPEVMPFKSAHEQAVVDGALQSECDGVEHHLIVRMKPDSGRWFHGGIANVDGVIRTCCFFGEDGSYSASHTKEFEIP